MAFIDLINAYKALIYTRFDNKTAPKSIKKTDSGNSFRELSDLILQAYQGTVPFNSAKFSFSTNDGSPIFSIGDYSTTFKPFYGNNPIIILFIKVPTYDTDGETIIGFTYQEEKQTPAIYTYESDDFTQDISEIRWEFPVATNGYVSISGPGIGLTGDTSGIDELPFSNTDLEVDTNGSFYLPLPLPNGRVPIFTSSNGKEIDANYEGDLTPPRLYGFANNDPQAIKVTVI